MMMMRAADEGQKKKRTKKEKKRKRGFKGSTPLDGSTFCSKKKRNVTRNRQEIDTPKRF